MGIQRQLILGAALFGLMSGTALAHRDIQFGLSIGVPVVPVYVDPAPVYTAPPQVYYGTQPDGYYVQQPPQVYYSAPAPSYYYPGPGVSIRYERAYPEYRERRLGHERRHHRDDDDD